MSPPPAVGDRARRPRLRITLLAAGVSIALSAGPLASPIAAASPPHPPTAVGVAPTAGTVMVPPAPRDPEAPVVEILPEAPRDEVESDRVEGDEAPGDAPPAARVATTPDPAGGMLLIIWAIALHGAGIAVIGGLAWWWWQHRGRVDELTRRPTLSLAGGMALLGMWTVLPIVAGAIVQPILPLVVRTPYDPETLTAAEELRVTAVWTWVTYPLGVLILWPLLIFFRRLADRRIAAQSVSPAPTAPAPVGDDAASTPAAAPVPVIPDPSPLVPVALSRPPRAWRSALLAAVLGYVLIWPVLRVAETFVYFLRIAVSGSPPEPIAHTSLRLLEAAGASDIWTASLIAGAVIGAPIVEEIVYRGGVQAALRGLLPGSVWIPILVTSGLFAYMHWGAVEPESLLVLFVLSLGFGFVYEWTGRLLAPIVMHAIFNAVNTGMLLIYSV